MCSQRVSCVVNSCSGTDYDNDDRQIILLYNYDDNDRCMLFLKMMIGE